MRFSHIHTQTHIATTDPYTFHTKISDCMDFSICVPSLSYSSWIHIFTIFIRWCAFWCFWQKCYFCSVANNIFFFLVQRKMDSLFAFTADIIRSFVFLTLLYFIYNLLEYFSVTIWCTLLGCLFLSTISISNWCISENPYISGTYILHDTI